MARRARRVARERVKPGPLRVTARARRRLGGPLRPVCTVARRAARRHVRVGRARLGRVARRARRVLPERARVRIVARRAGGMAFRCARGLLRMTPLTRGLLRRRVRLTMAFAAFRVAAPHRGPLSRVASSTERGARAGEPELSMRAMTSDACDRRCVERVFALRLDVARRASGGHPLVLWMGRMTADAGASFGGRMVRLHRRVARHACVRAAPVRRVRIVATRASGMLFNALRCERRHARMAGRARCASLRRRVRRVASIARGVASHFGHATTRRVASLARADGRFDGAMRLVTRDTRLVPGDARPARCDPRSSLGEHALRVRVAARASGLRGTARRMRRVARRADVGARSRHSGVERDLHSTMTRRLLVARGAIREKGGPVKRVAGRASDVLRCVRVEVFDVEIPNTCTFVAADARWCLTASRKDMARRARRRRVRVAVVRALVLRRMASRARIGEWLEPRGMAFGASDLLVADVLRVHRRRSRFLKSRRHVLDRDRRRRALSNREDHDDDGRDESEDSGEEPLLAEANHGTWHMRQGTSRFLSSALA
jgi:hypothetical protein